ncbi:unknown [Clostridium sp. CAG:440]|nr:unknown [Clostridium sp. CAG:440]HJJ16428.1 hypothetical protein [Clostridiaceae bacterium]
MENAADALKMAAWVLIFVVALSIIINAFGMARQTTDILISYNDNEYYTDYVEQGSTERKVGYETIIPAIYRAYKENYKIIFLNNDGTPMYFYENKNTKEQINYIDLEKQNVGNDTAKEEFIKYIVTGKEINNSQYKFENSYDIKNNGLYNQIKGKQFTESLGVYYQEEIDGNQSNTPDANKTKKRVITYKSL